MPSPWVLSRASPGGYAAFARLFPELAVPEVTPSATYFATTIVPDAIVLRHGGAVVGYACARPRGDRLHVVHVITDPEYRRRGVGRALMAAVAERARAAGFQRWRLNVKPENLAARALYERWGMKVVLASVSMRVGWSDVERIPCTPEHARGLLEGIRSHAAPGQDHLLVFVGGDPSLEAALASAGAEPALRALRMEGQIPDGASDL